MISLFAEVLSLSFFPRSLLSSPHFLILQYPEFLLHVFSNFYFLCCHFNVSKQCTVLFSVSPSFPRVNLLPLASHFLFIFPPHYLPLIIAVPLCYKPCDASKQLQKVYFSPDGDIFLAERNDVAAKEGKETKGAKRWIKDEKTKGRIRQNFERHKRVNSEWEQKNLKFSIVIICLRITA